VSRHGLPKIAIRPVLSPKPKLVHQIQVQYGAGFQVLGSSTLAGGIESGRSVLGNHVGRYVNKIWSGFRNELIVPRSIPSLSPRRKGNLATTTGVPSTSPFNL